MGLHEKKELFLIKKKEFFLIKKKRNSFFKKISKDPRFVRNFLTKLKFLKNSEFFRKDVLKRLLEGIETISVMYEVVFEK